MSRISHQGRSLSFEHCQKLEPRRLLAVILDPTFGAGDGFALLNSPFSTNVTGEEGEELNNLLVPSVISRLGGRYFTAGFQPLVGDGGTIFALKRFHALVEDDGAISTALARDTNDDGLVFYNTQESSGGFVGPGNYVDLAPLPNGSALALIPASSVSSDAQIVKVNPDGRESLSFKIDGLGAIEGPELLNPTTGVLLARVDASDAEAPIGPREQVYALHLFDVVSGELSDPVLPFGEWLRLDQVSSRPTLHVGRDGKVYVGTLTEDLVGTNPNPNDSGFLLARLRLSNGQLVLDQTFGGPLALPGQTTPAFYHASDETALSNTHNYIIAGATAQGRVWLLMPNPTGGAQGLFFSLLTPDGQIDPAFGEAGIVNVDFAAVPSLPSGRAEESLGFLGAREGGTTRPQPFVRADGSVVGVATVAAGTDLPVGTEWAIGIYGLMPDGSFDPRIAEAGSPHGEGRTIITTDDGDPEVSSLPAQGVAYLDEAERLIISTETFSDATPAGRTHLMVSRVLLGTPQIQTITRPNGDRVLTITGTSGNDRLILRAGSSGLELLQQPEGAVQSMLAQLDSEDLDLIEIGGGEGDDILFSHLNAFSGFVTVTGGAGNDTLSANGRFDRLFGDEGDDSLLGGLGAQVISGGAGNDVLVGGSGRDALFGEEGNDVLFGQSEGDFLSGGAGDDVMHGDLGNDTLDGGAGDDTMDGGDDIDLVSYAERALAVTASLFEGVGGAAAEADEYVDVERLLGGGGNDVLTGTHGLNFLAGGAGNDTLMGLGGRDTLLGGDGADVLDGGADDDLLVDFDALGLGGGPDLFIGGAGNDLALVDEEDEANEEVEGAFGDLQQLLAAIDERDAGLT